MAELVRLGVLPLGLHLLSERLVVPIHLTLVLVIPLLERLILDDLLLSDPAHCCQVIYVLPLLE